MQRVLVAILLVAAGGAGGFLAALRFVEKDVAAPIPEAAPADGRAQREASTARNEAALPNESSAPAPSEADVADSGATIVIRDAIPPTVPLGAGRFHGVVATTSGAPLAGVRIRVLPSNHNHGIEFHEEFDVDVREYLESFAQLYRWKRSLFRETVTDASGRYELRDLPAMGFSLTASLDGFRFDAERGRNYNLAPDAEVDFIAKPVVAVSVAVRLPTGEMASEANILCTEGNNTTYLPWSASKRTITLAHGTYALSAAAGKFQEFKSDAETVVIGEDQDVPDLEFKLQGRNGIRGVVVLPKDEDGINASVACNKAADSTSPNRRGMDHESRQHISRGAQHFSYLDLEPGTYRIDLYRSYNGPAVSSTVVEVDSGVKEIEVTLPPRTRAESSVLWAYDNHGELIDDIHSLQYSLRSAGNNHGGGLELTRKKDGSYWFTAQFVEEEFDEVEKSFAEDAVLTLTIQSRAHGQKQFSATYGKPQEYTVTFSPPATLAVLVSGYSSGVNANFS
ncbi:MAG: carboxypeptidase-like regulatory domain-containing protein [Planctomycetes bacterium]|nr:carboxypeptidase-like regulatory domain-containing protein [Planctomycetota bacterium]